MTPRKSKSDLDSLQGAWSIAALEMDGHMMAAEMLSAASIVVEGDRFQSLGMGAKYEGKVVLDPTANPKAFDLVFTNGGGHVVLVVSEQAAIQAPHTGARVSYVSLRSLRGEFVGARRLLRG